MTLEKSQKDTLLSNKGKHGTSVARIFFEIFLVTLVFLYCPNVHLAGGNDIKEEGYRKRVSKDKLG